MYRDGRFRAPPLPDPQTSHGPDGVLQMHEDWTTSFGEFEMEMVELAEVGDRVVVELIQRGTGLASGAEVAGRFWFVYTIEDGKITRQDVYASRAQAHEATRA
jgi:ketosteroid isomerase-like protein